MAAACALVATSALSASALPNTDDEIAQLIDQVAPDQGVVVQGESSDSQGWVVARKEGTNVVPVDPAAPIQIGGASSGQGLEISLPQNLNLGDGRAASDGTIVYQSVDANVDAAVQAMDDGTVRVQTIIQAPAAAHEFSYGIGEGFQPVEAEDGSMWIVGFDESGEYQAYSVGAAWAQDANGSEVSTSYEIRGNELVQTVQPSASTAYPIVADPTWQWYSAAYGAGFSKSETRYMVIGSGASGFCGWVPAGVLRLACATAGVTWGAQAALAVNANGCVFLAAVPAPIAMRWVSPECK